MVMPGVEAGSNLSYKVTYLLLVVESEMHGQERDNYGASGCRIPLR
jgi:hypothetical protein